MRAHDVCVYYGAKKAIDEVSIDIHTEHVTAFIGPSGCGKSTFLRTLNRMNDTIPSARVTGDRAGWGGYLCQRDGCGAIARTGGHGVPEAQPLPQIDL